MPKLSHLEATLLSAPEPLLLRVVSFWTLWDIINCHALSTTMHGIVRYYKSLAWDPDFHFRPWFIDEPSTFRAMLKDYGAVIAGSQVVQLLDRSKYPDSDMDIFMRSGSVEPMGYWLQHQGYRFQNATPTYDDVGNQAFLASIRCLSTKLVSNKRKDDPVNRVFNYQRYIASRTIIYHQVIQLVAVDMNPIHHIIFDFHSTGVMNYMTADTVVSVFPRSTFLLHKSYSTRNRTERETDAAKWRCKYRDRGFRIIRKRTRGNHTDLKLGKRSSNDRHAWVIRLEPPPLRQREFELSLLGLTVPICPNPLYGQLETDVHFDVMHWRSGATLTDSFARVAEPGIWR
ncbi:hypothetical protein C8R47DRAFT_1211021 [Mycena vitilis]|nr:hypothetical protein C8R47DRAFT_1211021 [Mycena vitilis]